MADHVDTRQGSDNNTRSSVLHSMVQLPSRIFVKSFLKGLLKIFLKLWRWASSFIIVIFFAAWFYGGLLPYLVSIIAILSLIYQLSDTLLYQPEQPVESRVFVPTPNSFFLPFETVFIMTRDRVKLHSYLIKQQMPNYRSLPVLIYFHGNAGNIGHRLENVKLFHNKLKVNTLLVEYRGYGLSEGIPSEKGFYLDAQAAFEYVTNREDLDSSKIILFGRSLGGAVAIDLAARTDFRDRVSALIVENTFLSIPDLARILFPFRAVKMIPRFFFKNRYENYEKISFVVCPTLFISGTKDELIPPKMMNDLFSRCSAGMKRLHRYPGGHNDTWLAKNYSLQLAEFLDEVILTSPNERNHALYEPFKDNIV